MKKPVLSLDFDSINICVTLIFTFLMDLIDDSIYWFLVGGNEIHATVNRWVRLWLCLLLLPQSDS